MSIKGFRSQQALQRKLGDFTEDQSIDQSRFVTVQEMSGRRHGLDVIISGAYQVGGTLTAANGSNIRVIKCAAHGALKGDIIRLSNGTQFAALSVPDINTIITTVELDVNPSGDTFTVWRHIVPACKPDGSLVTTSGPTSYSLDGVNTTVAQDTVAPVNNRPLPVNLLLQEYDNAPASYNPNVFYDGTGSSLCTIDLAVSSQLSSMYSRQADGFQITQIGDINHTAIASYDSLGVVNGVSGFNSIGTFVTGYGNAVVAPKISRVPTASIYHDYSTGNVTTAAWSSFVTEAGSTTLNSFSKIEIFDSSGEVVMLGVGAVASEIVQMLIIPGGNGMVEWSNSLALRISFKAKTTNITSGILIINFYL